MAAFSIDLDEMLTDCEDMVRDRLQDQIRFASFALTSVTAQTDIPRDDWVEAYSRQRRMEEALNVLLKPLSDFNDD